MPTQIDPIPGTQMLSQFQNTIAHGLAITKIASFNPFQAHPNLGLRLLIAQRLKPLGDRLLAVGSLVSENFNHDLTVAYKLRQCKHTARPSHGCT